MAKPNKTVAAARKRMGGFPQQAKTPARQAELDAFGEFMNWCVKQADAGRNFKTVEEARAAFDKENEQ